MPKNKKHKKEKKRKDKKEKKRKDKKEKKGKKKSKKEVKNDSNTVELKDFPESDNEEVIKEKAEMDLKENSCEDSLVELTPSRKNNEPRRCLREDSDEEDPQIEANLDDEKEASRSSSIQEDSSNDDLSTESEQDNMQGSTQVKSYSSKKQSSGEDLVNSDSDLDVAVLDRERESPPKTPPKHNGHQHTESDSDSESESPTRKSPRKSVSSTTEKIIALSEDVTLYSDQDDDPMIHTFKATRKQKEEDESSYKADESDHEDSDEDYDSDAVENDERDIFNDEMSFANDMGSDDEEDSSDEGKLGANGKSPGRNINNDNIFDCESGSETDNATPPKRLKLTPLKLRKSGQFGYEDDSNVSDEDEIKSTLKNVQLARTCIPVTCSSLYDEITSELLPSLHVCYLAPDGRTRHCFSLDTIYRASMMSGIKQQKSDGTGGLSFLQPPHFRTTMDDSLIDQIASRFGRQALVIEESNVYKKEHDKMRLGLQYNSVRAEIALRDGGGDSDAIDVDDPEQTFRERFDNYLKKQMGSGDIYVCPVCYCEAQRRFNSENEDDDEDSEQSDSEVNDYTLENITGYSKADPMTILGALDHDSFEVAAAFCFPKLSLVKKHIRSVHKQSTSEKDLNVNDFLKRFMIRAQDGLLQRYLHAFWKHNIFSGAMRKFWYEGHNQSFILLRILIEQHQCIEENNPDDILPSFSESFPRRAAKMWTNLSAPYSNSDASDFIESEEGEDFSSHHPFFEKPESIEDELLQHLKMKRENARGKRHAYDSTSSDESEIEEYSSSEDEILEVGSVNEEDFTEESSEDDWVASKRAKARDKKMPSKNKKLIKSARTDSDDDGDSVLFVSSSPSKTASRQIETLATSSDESDVKEPPSKKNRISTKVTIIDSDEE